MAEKEGKKEIDKILWRKETSRQLKKSASDKIDKIDEEKHNLLRMSEISLWLDHYDDIFSDFDPRPFSQRALSDDFLFEAKKASKEKISGTIQLSFLVPSGKRNSEIENTIRKRLHEHFKRHHDMLHAETGNLKQTGFIFSIIGILMMLAATYVSLLSMASHFLSNLLTVILEPGGWFLVWYGLDRLFFIPEQKKAELEFYEKMSKVEINFLNY